MTEPAGECRVFGSEEEAVWSVSRGEVGEGALLVVGGCGPRGGPGLLRLDALGRLTKGVRLEVPVLTDGLAPEDVLGPRISLFTPEAAAGGVLSLLRDGDHPEDRSHRGPHPHRGQGVHGREPASSQHAGTAYAARYARTALPALEGAGLLARHPEDYPRLCCQEILHDLSRGRCVGCAELYHVASCSWWDNGRSERGDSPKPWHLSKT